MQARPKRRTVHRDGYGSKLETTLKNNGLDLFDNTTAALARPEITQPVTARQVADRYALLAAAETRRQYREFRRRQVAFKRLKAAA